MMVLREDNHVMWLGDSFLWAELAVYMASM